MRYNINYVAINVTCDMARGGMENHSEVVAQISVLGNCIVLTIKVPAF